MPTCVASNCKNRNYKGSGITFHRFPTRRPEIAKKWLENIDRPTFIPTITSVVCSRHFEERCFNRSYSTAQLRDDAVPTIFNASVKEENEESSREIESPKAAVPSGYTGKSIRSDEVSDTTGGIRCSKRPHKRKLADPNFEYGELPSLKKEVPDPDFEREYLPSPKKKVAKPSLEYECVPPLKRCYVDLGPRNSIHKLLNSNSILDKGPSNLVQKKSTPRKSVDVSPTKIKPAYKAFPTKVKPANKASFVRKGINIGKENKKTQNNKKNTTSQRKTAVAKKDTVTYLPNNFVHFEFATPRKQVILKMSTESKHLLTRCTSLHEVINLLKDKGVLKNDSEELLGSFSSFPKTAITFRKRGVSEEVYHERFSDSEIDFATVLFINSPDAFDAVSEVFSLPEKSVVRSMILVKDYFPGFTREALEILRDQIDRAPCNRLCSILFDNVCIQKKCSFDAYSEKWIGYVNYGRGPNPSECDEVPLADEVLIISAVGLGSNWKLPFGYFPCKGSTPELLKNLIKEAICVLEQYDLNVRAVVCNGSSVNINLGRLLGCSINSQTCKEMVTTFPHPDNEEKRIHLVFGVRHSLQMMRKLMSDKGTLQSSVYGKIEWRYIEQIISPSKWLKTCDVDMTQRRFYQLRKILGHCDSIFNSTCVSALELAEEFKLEEFDGCLNTAEFVADVQRASDILNSRNPVSSEDMPPIHYDTLMEQVESMIDVAGRILDLEFKSGKRVVESGRWRAVAIFAFTLKSVSQLAVELLQDKTLRYLNTYRLSVDHSDMLLNHLQRQGRWTDLPSCADFRDAYKDLFVSPEKSVNFKDFEGDDLTVGQGDIYSFQHHIHNYKSNSNCDSQFWSSNLIDLRTDEINKGSCVAQLVVQRLSCPSCVGMMIEMDSSHGSGSYVDCSITMPSNFLLKILKGITLIVKGYFLETKCFALEDVVVRVLGDFCAFQEISNLTELTCTHFEEEPNHVICLLKVIIRTFITLCIQNRQNGWRSRWVEI